MKFKFEKLRNGQVVVIRNAVGATSEMRVLTANDGTDTNPTELRKIGAEAFVIDYASGAETHLHGTYWFNREGEYINSRATKIIEIKSDWVPLNRKIDTGLKVSIKQDGVKIKGTVGEHTGNEHGMSTFIVKFETAVRLPNGDLANYAYYNECGWLSWSTVLGTVDAINGMRIRKYLAE